MSSSSSSSQSSDAPFGVWTTRPSILSHPGFHRATLSRRDFLEAYRRDASAVLLEADGRASVPPRKPRSLRVLQWNVNGFAGDTGLETTPLLAQRISETILQADADCIFLNEFSWNFADHDSAQETLRRILQQEGYHTQLCASQVECPTFCATRLPTRHAPQEIRLSHERSAIVLQLKGSDDEEQDVTVVGTHLDHECGRQRHYEMKTLLQGLFPAANTTASRTSSGNPQDTNCGEGLDATSASWTRGELNQYTLSQRMILVGDLNQQRRVDYTPLEWNMALVPNMKSRGVCDDDGVDEMLQRNGFVCAWDDKTTDCTKNWTTTYPPSTHWSGTTVDYAYGRSMHATRVFVSPTGWSDHRMTVVDWKWP